MISLKKAITVGVLCATLVATATEAGAAPFAAPSPAVQAATSGSMVEQVQVRRRYVGPVRRRGGGGGAAAAAVGLGILGAVIATQAYRSRGCWYERRQAFDDWGNFVGYRRVRVCQ